MRPYIISLFVASQLITASAQTPPGPEWAYSQLPANTQLYLELQPKQPLSSGPSLAARLRRSPLTRVLANALQLTAEQSSQLREIPLWDGRLRFALTREGETSPFEKLEQQSQRQTRESELRYAAEMAFEEVNFHRRSKKRFPTKVEELEAYDPSLTPEGAQLSLERKDKKMTVVGKWQTAQGEPIEIRWPDPEYRSATGWDKAGGLLLALGCPNSNQLQPYLERWDPEWEELSRQGDHWELDLEGDKLALYLRKNWIYVTNRSALVEQLESPQSADRNLRDNPRFAEQSRRLQRPETEFWVFLDVQDILASSPALAGQAGLAPDKVMIRSFGMTSGSTLSGGLLESRGDAFLQWDGVQNVTLGPSSANALASRIPARSETAYWIDLGGWVRLTDRLSGEIPLLSEGMQAIWQGAEEKLGFPLSREALAQGAHAFFYTEFVDTTAFQLDLLVDVLKVYVGMGQGQEPDFFPLSKVPLVAVVELQQPEMFAKIKQRLSELLGTSPRKQKQEGQSYQLSSNGVFALGELPGALFWCNGYTERLLPGILAAYQGQTQTMAGEASFQRFWQERQGELLAYHHAKVDLSYTILKSFLLFLGSDFRTEAEILGRMRDSHSSLEVVPGGLKVRSHIYSDGVTAPAAAPTEEE